MQIAFGASLLGLTTASCVPEPRSAQSPPPKPVPPLHEIAEATPPIAKPEEQQNAEGMPRAGAIDTSQAPGVNEIGNAGTPSTVVAIYGGSSVAIHGEVEYTRNSLVIDAEGERTLAALKEALDAFDCDIVIQGHAGRDETKAANWLSKRRAELVRDRLIVLGVDGSRLSVEARTPSPRRETSPRAPGRDRRVSFVFHARANSSHLACDASDRRKP